MNLRELPPSARALATAIAAAVDAARLADADGLRAAAVELAGLAGRAGLSTEHTPIVLGAVIRTLLEEQYPDGLDGDDIGAVIEGRTRSAVVWLPEVDPQILLIGLAGALGIHPEEQDGVARPTGPAMALHAPLLIAELLDSGRGQRSLDPYLGAAFAEIARSELMEAP